MIIPPVVFADTAFFVARFRPADQFHAIASAWNKYLSAKRIRIITTEAVLIEWLNAYSDHRLRGIAYTGYRAIHTSPSAEVLPFEDQSYTQALALYAASKDKNWALTDCLSFVIMRQRKLTAALTSDHHFTQAGFEALMLQPPTAE